jgi:SNF2 family DNA or RNA helicase
MNLQQLHDYQKRTANFIAKHPRAIISVDMGLGKTAAVLGWMNWYAQKRGYNVRGLIIAPKRVAENNWLQEAQNWGLDQLAARMIICAGTAEKRRKALADDAHPIKIISRDNFKDYANAAADFLIIDELTSYKNPTAARTKAAASISASYKIGLTGTFLANGAIDIYGQALAVGLSWGSYNFYAWRGAYFRDALAGSGLAFQKWRLRCTLEELLAPIRENIFTLTAADYLTIPAVTNTTHKVDVGDEIKAAISDLDAFLSMEIGDEVLTFDENQKFAKLQTLCDGFVYQEDDDTKKPVRGNYSAKLEAVADFVADCRDAGEPVLLFYAFREEAAWLAELLEDRGVKWYSVKKSDFMEKWNAREIDCLIAHPASAGHGLNLQHGGRVIVWSTLTYNYEFFAQGNARLARQGQKRNVQIHYFVADGTCEERAVSALLRKEREQGEFLRMTKQ